MIVLAILFIGICIIAFMSVFIPRRNIRKNGERASAVVVRTTLKKMVRGAAYVPVISYSVDGRKRVVEMNVAHNKKLFYDGASVNIIYDRRDPSKVILEDDKSTYINIAIGILCGIIGIGITLIRILASLG